MKTRITGRRLPDGSLRITGGIMTEQTTPKTPWTSEPWRTAVQDLATIGGHGQRIIIDGCEPASPFKRLITSVPRSHEGDAERIVACVNAMAGIADPQAFVETYRAQRDAADALAEACEDIEFAATNQWNAYRASIQRTREAYRATVGEVQ